MADYVDREAVLALAKDIVVPFPGGEYRHRCIDPQAVRELPSAERKNGKWLLVKERDEDGNAFYICSECHAGESHVPEVEVNYCWKCGAYMRGEK